MKAICIREIKSFFGSLIGYLVIAVFLSINGLLLWIFDGVYNIPQSSFADLSPFFLIAPWILIFLVPAVTMKSFSEEIKQGTIELLLTKPLSVWEIVLGKFLGVIILILIAILPTFIYVLVLKEFTLSGQSFDFGNIAGSYFGLFFLVAAYASLGVFSSSLTDNQIVSFIVAVLLCVFFSLGIAELAEVFASGGNWIEKIGLQYHFRSISRGVIDTRDLLFFVSFAVAFLGLTVFKIKTIRK